MLYIDIPSKQEFDYLNRHRSEASVSIYLRTTPVSQDSEQSRIELGNLLKEAEGQMTSAGFDKRKIESLVDHIAGLIDDDEFWQLQANSLAVLATPSSIRAYRMANAVTPMAQVADRFHLKPLLRAVTFPQSAFVLALSENAVRLIEIYSDLPPTIVDVPNLPKDAASAVRKSSLNKRAPVGRIQGAEGQNVRYRQYSRAIDSALRSILAGRDIPLILATTERLGSIYRSVNSYPNLLSERIEASPDKMSEAELAHAARAVLDNHNNDELARFASLFQQRSNEGRATTDLSDAARAATYGAIDTILVDIDSVTAGTIDETTGAIMFADSDGAESYGICDEIMGRALVNGAKVMGVRKSDLPNEGELAAILRYAV